ncbi:MAG: Nif3-like dinuclear metal center hexameric protein [Desulfosarcinaceae bacterium]|nr:Nif3-like dinuclear metal center hexameric protein [Desulfosarcinaceae bacterium]
MTATLADIIQHMTALAPPALAESWDNCGLQVGDPRWPVRRILVALDPLPAVIQEASEKEIDLLITHHPLLMQPLKQIDFNSPAGKIIAACAVRQMAIFAAHTNLDSVKGGLNDHLANLLNLQKRKVLRPAAAPARAKLVIFVPADAEAAIRQALFSAGAGLIGDYSHCAFRLEGQGSFRPGAASRPAIGQIGRTETVGEVRLETIVPQHRLPAAVAAAEAAHPYETMAWDAYPLLTDPADSGLGRVGDLPEEISLKALADRVKMILGAAFVRVVGVPQARVATVALCTGSGGSLLDAFFGSGAQAFITGDVRYHDARSVEDAGKGLIDVGHFASERIVVNHLVTQLRNRLADRHPDIAIMAATQEREPFYLV